MEINLNISYSNYINSVYKRISENKIILITSFISFCIFSTIVYQKYKFFFATQVDKNVNKIQKINNEFLKKNTAVCAENEANPLIIKDDLQGQISESYGDEYIEASVKIAEKIIDEKSEEIPIGVWTEENYDGPYKQISQLTKFLSKELQEKLLQIFQNSKYNPIFTDQQFKKGNIDYNTFGSVTFGFYKNSRLTSAPWIAIRVYCQLTENNIKILSTLDEYKHYYNSDKNKNKNKFEGILILSLFNNKTHLNKFYWKQEKEIGPLFFKNFHVINIYNNKDHENEYLEIGYELTHQLLSNKKATDLNEIEWHLLESDQF